MNPGVGLGVVDPKAVPAPLVLDWKTKAQALALRVRKTSWFPKIGDHFTGGFDDLDLWVVEGESDAGTLVRRVSRGPETPKEFVSSVEVVRDVPLASLFADGNRCWVPDTLVRGLRRLGEPDPILVHVSYDIAAGTAFCGAQVKSFPRRNHVGWSNVERATCVECLRRRSRVIEADRFAVYQNPDGTLVALAFAEVASARDFGRGLSFATDRVSVFNPHNLAADEVEAFRKHVFDVDRPDLFSRPGSSAAGLGAKRREAFVQTVEGMSEAIRDALGPVTASVAEFARTLDESLKGLRRIKEEIKAEGDEE